MSVPLAHILVVFMKAYLPRLGELSLFRTSILQTSPTDTLALLEERGHTLSTMSSRPGGAMNGFRRKRFPMTFDWIRVEGSAMLLFGFFERHADQPLAFTSMLCST